MPEITIDKFPSTTPSSNMLIPMYDNSSQETKKALLEEVRNIAATIDEGGLDKTASNENLKAVNKKVADLATHVDDSFKTVNDNFTNVGNEINDNKKAIDSSNQDLQNHENDADLHTSKEKQAKWDSYGTQLSDLTSNKISKRVRYYTGAEVTAGASPNNILEGSFLIASPNNPFPNAFCYYQQYFFSEVSAIANRIQYVTTYNTSPTRQFIRRYFNGTWEVKEISMVDDTGWINLPIVAGYLGTLKYRRIGSMVELRGAVTNVLGMNAYIAVLPVGFRPVDNVAMTGTEDTWVWNGVIYTDGNVKIKASSRGTYSSSYLFYIDTVFFIN